MNKTMRVGYTRTEMMTRQRIEKKTFDQWKKKPDIEAMTGSRHVYKQIIMCNYYVILHGLQSGQWTTAHTKVWILR